MKQVIDPGSVIGVLGSGQLGRMFAVAARQMGYQVHVFSPDYDTPAGQVADLEIQSDYQDLDRVARFASSVDVVTFEFENIPVSTIETACQHVLVHPAGKVLYTTRNRLREKEFLRGIGLPVTPFAPVRSLADVEQAVEVTGLPAVLKTASWGYDGKGQSRVSTVEEVRRAWQALESQEAVLERLVEFAAEISVVAVRSSNGECACYEPIRNVHRHHILDISSSPAELPLQTEAAAMDMAHAVMVGLDVIGVLCVEFFLTQDGSLLINELAPRPHNSGHLTVDAHVTSQFEQQVRAVCGFPPGSTARLQPAAMVNLMGDLWSHRRPAWSRVLDFPDVKLHLYGKRTARSGRKMGHLTALGRSAQEAIDVAGDARNLLIKAD